MSPTAENALYVPYEDNPFPYFFKCGVRWLTLGGLNVCLSSDNPLQHYFTPEPLLEELTIAARLVLERPHVAVEV